MTTPFDPATASIRPHAVSSLASSPETEPLAVARMSSSRLRYSPSLPAPGREESMRPHIDARFPRDRMKPLLHQARCGHQPRRALLQALPHHRHEIRRSSPRLLGEEHLHLDSPFVPARNGTKRERIADAATSTECESRILTASASARALTLSGLSNSAHGTGR